jgi:hypothetical protein
VSVLDLPRCLESDDTMGGESRFTSELAEYVIAARRSEAI